MNKLNELTGKSNIISKKIIREEFDDNIRLKFTVKKIAFKIFYELKSREMSQQDLADVLGVTSQNVSKMLSGEDYNISTLVKIEEALSINLIDREIYNDRNHISFIFYFKNFGLKTKPVIFDHTCKKTHKNFQTYKAREIAAFIISSNFKQSIIINESVKEYF